MFIESATHFCEFSSLRHTVYIQCTVYVTAQAVCCFTSCWALDVLLPVFGELYLVLELMCQIIPFLGCPSGWLVLNCLLGHNLTD